METRLATLGSGGGREEASVRGHRKNSDNSHLVILDQPAKEGRRGHYSEDHGHWLLLHSGERRGSIKNPGDSLGAALPGGDYKRAAAATTAQ